LVGSATKGAFGFPAAAAEQGKRENQGLLLLRSRPLVFLMLLQSRENQRSSPLQQ
jgi:hypothetical protein